MIKAALGSFFALAILSCTSTDPASAQIDTVFAKNVHEIDTSQDTSGRSCYAAFESPRHCTEGFAAATGCSGNSLVTKLRPNLEGRDDEGCYYFCPNVPNCIELSMDEVAQLACKYAAANGIAQHLSLRSVCGPKTDTSFGSCCWGVDANVVVE